MRYIAGEKEKPAGAGFPSGRVVKFISGFLSVYYAAN